MKLIQSIQNSARKEFFEVLSRASKNIEMIPRIDSDKSMECYLACLFSVNALNMAICGNSVFNNNNVNLRVFDDVPEGTKINDKQIIALFEDSLKKSQFHPRKLKIGNKAFLLRILAQLPSVFTYLLIIFLGFFCKGRVIELEDAFFFTRNNPDRLDFAMQKISLDWQLSSSSESEKIIVICPNYDNLSRSDLTLVLEQLGQANLMNIEILSLIDNKKLKEEFHNTFIKRLFESKFALIKYAVQQRGIFIVNNELSSVVALLRSDQIILAKEDYSRKDFSWGKITGI